MTVMTSDEWQAHMTREAARAIGTWLEGHGRLHQRIGSLTLADLEANRAMILAEGLDGVLPQGCGEKIICLRNRHDLGLVNGMFVTLDDIHDIDRLSFSATLSTEDGITVAGRHRFYKGHYDDHIVLDPERARRDWRDMRTLIETVWGYAITCHKAQGSQWPNVIVYDDGLGRTAEDRSRWLYTAITRAERGLVLLD